MRRGRFWISDIGTEIRISEEERYSYSRSGRTWNSRSASAVKRVLFMAEDVSSVVARRFRNATEPITEISLNVDGGARMQKEKAIPAFTRATPFVKYPRWRLLYGSPPTECEVNYAGT